MFFRRFCTLSFGVGAASYSPTSLKHYPQRAPPVKCRLQAATGVFQSQYIIAWSYNIDLNLFSVFD